MKKIILSVVIALGIISTFSACEKNEYKHPLHRSK